MPESNKWDELADLLESSGWDFPRLVAASTLSRATLYQTFKPNGTQPITEEIANELARVTGRAASEWLAIQAQHDLRKG